MKKRLTSEEVVARQKAWAAKYYQRPEVQERKKVYAKAYSQSPAAIAARRAAAAQARARELAARAQIKRDRVERARFRNPYQLQALPTHRFIDEVRIILSTR